MGCSKRHAIFDDNSLCKGWLELKTTCKKTGEQYGKTQKFYFCPNCSPNIDGLPVTTTYFGFGANKL